MTHKYILSIATFFMLICNVVAQRPIRKGTTPLMKKSKNAQQVAAFTLEQLTGKWQESVRTGRDTKNSVGIKDTLYLNFFEKNKVIAREGNNPVAKGAAEIDADNTLTAAADEYTIISVNDKEMVLDDNDKYLHTFLKKDAFWFESAGKDSVRQETVASVVEIKPENIMGKWMVYKRNAKPGAVKSNVPIIRYLKVISKTDETTAAGFITFYKEDTTQELACKITFYKTGIMVDAEKNNWYLPVYKADGKELIFGNIELMLYYCKLLD